MLCAKTLASGLGAKFQAYEAIPGHCSLVFKQYISHGKPIHTFETLECFKKP